MTIEGNRIARRTHLNFLFDNIEGSADEGHEGASKATNDQGGRESPIRPVILLQCRLELFVN